MITEQQVESALGFGFPATGQTRPGCWVQARRITSGRRRAGDARRATRCRGRLARSERFFFTRSGLAPRRCVAFSLATRRESLRKRRPMRWSLRCGLRRA